ncbi:MAG: peptide chain release factor 2 [Christensenellales bacterium]
MLRSVFDTDKIKKEIKELEQAQEAENFWQDAKQVKAVGQQLKQRQDKIKQIAKFENKLSDIEMLCELLEIENDNALYAELKQTLSTFEDEMEELRLETLLTGKYDANNAIVTLHSGAGGTEAQDWTSMLFRMYQMFAEKHDYTFTVLDLLDGDEAGIKSVSFLIEGENAYGYLKCEKGVHRLVRISPFDSNARRHTSFASVEVMPEIEDEKEVEIKSEDLRVDTYRSSGAGGQHVNKTESAIRITHLPTGIVVACQTERSQIQNRETAMKMLRSKLVELKEQQEMEKLNAIRGDIKKIEWGSQIRSYVFHPYSMVKDHRTGFETSDVQGVMNGLIMPFINDYLKKTSV